MRANYIHYGSPQFRLLSDKQIEELHFATLQIMERTGVLFECQAALDILREAGADVSDPSRVKIPSYLVEQALRTAPKLVTFYTREGELAMVLNGQTGCHWGTLTDCIYVLDLETNERRPCYVEDIADTARLIDAMPNMEWSYLATGHRTIPGAIADKVSLLQFVLNCSKTVIAEISDVSSLREMIALCSIVAGGEEKLRKKPFFGGSSEPVSPLVQGKDAMEKSLLCAEKGIPNVVYGMQMAGATTPATFAGCLAIANAEVLSQLVVLQLKYPGAPVIYGGIPSIMDMKTMIYSYGAPELSLLVAALTELSHYYRLPMFGTAGIVDAEKVDAQAAAEATYQILMTALSGADLVHDIAITEHGTILSQEFMVFCNELIDMVNVSMGGIEINDETLPLDLIERVGPRGTYISEKHTLKHFRKFWAPTIFDRSVVKDENTKRCADLLKEKTAGILKTHQPKLLPDDVLKEVKKMEAGWLERVGLKEYPKRP